METKFEWTAIHKHPNGTEIESIAESTTANYSAVVIDYKIELGVTALRDDPDYIRYYINWTRLITTGIIPVALLIYFNYGIFRGIQVVTLCRHNINHLGKLTLMVHQNKEKLESSILPKDQIFSIKIAYTYLLINF